MRLGDYRNWENYFEVDVHWYKEFKGIEYQIVG